MNETKFWELIEKSREAAIEGDVDGSQDRQVARLTELLQPLSPRELVKYRDYFYYFMDKAFTWDLWGVAYILGEGCSTDWFAYFRSWLISMGRENYERALADPASVDVIRRLPGVEDIFFERLTYVPRKLYVQKTGKEPPDVARLYKRDKPGPSGKKWETDADLRARFPRLYAKYSDH